MSHCLHYCQLPSASIILHLMCAITMLMLPVFDAGLLSLVLLTPTCPMLLADTLSSSSVQPCPLPHTALDMCPCNAHAPLHLMLSFSHQHCLPLHTPHCFKLQTRFHSQQFTLVLHLMLHLMHTLPMPKLCIQCCPSPIGTAYPYMPPPHQQNLTLLATTCQCLDETCSLLQVICKENPCKPGKLGQFLIDGLEVPCNELATSMITLSLAHHMPLWLAITIYVPTQLPCGLWQVICYSLVGLEKIFCLACLIWTYNRIGKAPASHKSSKPLQVMLDFADASPHASCRHATIHISFQ